jgi:hypothetical protein
MLEHAPHKTFTLQAGWAENWGPCACTPQNVHNAKGNAGLGWQQRGRPRVALWWPASKPVGLAVLSFCLSMLPFATKGSNSQKESGGGGEEASA